MIGLFAPSSAPLIGPPGQRGTHLPHCKVSDSDENERARQIAERVSSVSSQAPLRHLSANAGVGRERCVMAELDSAGYFSDGPLPTQNDPLLPLNFDESCRSTRY